MDSSHQNHEGDKIFLIKFFFFIFVLGEFVLYFLTTSPHSDFYFNQRHTLGNDSRKGSGLMSQNCVQEFTLGKQRPRR